MTDSQYFSFFGSVKTAESPVTDLIEVGISQHPMGEDERDYQAWRVRATMDAVQETVRGLSLTLLESDQDSSTESLIYRIDEQRALLVVQNEWAWWINWGVVTYPLQFDYPAQIAGAYCQPRYGLSR